MRVSVCVCVCVYIRMCLPARKMCAQGRAFKNVNIEM